MKLISLVVPVYNEEQMLPIFFEKVEELFIDNKDYHYEFVLIDDGSKDSTMDLIREKAKTCPRLSYISFSRNYGQEAAVEAGLKAAKGDAIIPLDCDFQDPPETVFEMLKKFEEGYEVVNGKRRSRNDDTAMKKGTAGLFYKLTNKIAGKKVIEENVCFFRLMSRRVVDHINSLPESYRTLRASVPFVGFKTCDVTFDRVQRKAGKTKYNYRKLLGIASKTFTSATPNLLTYPFKITIASTIVSFLGALAFMLCFFLDTVRALYYQPFMYFFLFLLAGSLIAMIFTIHSLYLRNIYENVQNRPRYFIQEEHVATNLKDKESE